ncbi:hypothetical protein BDV96DRAFT_568077 [Lophiotrema nucula]|uniref:F-box domain-containing protein n=1 Tax=Lophiotrema nucula TaxID=690887 RepID=A0A6A5ZL24_9PLEO|nr:hypothetical protein BDV96DRAFT_568077 [Lophiotrema nucula]
MKTVEMDSLIAGFGKMKVVDTMQPFRFFDLPYELRLKVYELLLVAPKTIDLDPANIRTIVPRMSLFYVNHRMHEEAYRVFYGSNTFRIFPIHGRFFHTRAPLLARLPARYRAAIIKLELRLGPGWTEPPRGWALDSRLGLSDLAKVKFLRIFVECDPASDEIFQGFRVAEDFYTKFCVNLLCGLMFQVADLGDIEFDAYPSVKKSSPLLRSLLEAARDEHKRILWGPERGWDKIVDVNLVNVLEGLSLGAPTLPTRPPREPLEVLA